MATTTTSWIRPENPELLPKPQNEENNNGCHSYGSLIGQNTGQYQRVFSSHQVNTCRNNITGRKSVGNKMKHVI